MSDIETTFQLQRVNFSLDISFSIPGKGITALFGHSGSGKTTVLRCMAGLEGAKNGYLKVGDHLWQNKHKSIPAHKRPIGYVFQDSNLFEHLSVEGNLRFGLSRVARALQQISFDEAVGLLGLKDFLGSMPWELSGGQRQRVAIGRALLTSPELLLMDEPLASLDLQSKHEILPYLEKLNDQYKIPIIYVSHSPDEILRIADYMVLLNQGKVEAQGEVNELLTRTDLPLAYLEEACAVVNGRVLEHDEKYHLTYLSLKGGKAAVSYRNLPFGHPVRVRILARDVSLALHPSEQTSISNIFPVRITQIVAAHDPAKVLVKLDMDGENLLSQITARSADVLKLQEGKLIFAQVKSVALMR